MYTVPVDTPSAIHNSIHSHPPHTTQYTPYRFSTDVKLVVFNAPKGGFCIYLKNIILILQDGIQFVSRKNICL